MTCQQGNRKQDNLPKVLQTTGIVLEEEGILQNTMK
jgi:hypothetical protein